MLVLVAKLFIYPSTIECVWADISNFIQWVVQMMAKMCSNFLIFLIAILHNGGPEKCLAFGKKLIELYTKHTRKVFL